MTMIVVHTTPGRAAICTDGLAYNASGTVMVAHTEPKVTLLDGIDAAATYRGSVVLGENWKDVARRMARMGADVDHIAADAPWILGELVDRHPEAVGRYSPTLDAYEPADVEAYLVGWSGERGRMVAYAFASFDDFAAHDITDEFHVVPAPPGCPPSRIEQHRRERNGVDPLPDGEPAPPPTTDAQWRHLAQVIHRSRAQASPASGLKVLLGADVVLTSVERGRCEQRVVHRFDSDDFAKMAAGTLHEVAQLGPCPCGSDHRFVDCCLPRVFDEPCLCGSGSTFAQCCKVATADREAAVA